MTKSILIVDDNVDLADGLVLVLEDDYDAEVAYSAEEALEKLEQKKYDWVLTDVKMPGMNGIELKQRIEEKAVDTRVMIMSGFRVEQLVEEVLQASPAMVLRELDSAAQLDELLSQSLVHGMVLLDKASSPATESLVESLQEKDWSVNLFAGQAEAVTTAGGGKTVTIIDDGGSVVDALVLCLKTDVAQAGPVVLVIDTSDVEEGVDDPFKSHKVSGCLFKPFYFDKVFDVLES
jgi:DNA-binding NtrC family response regulator